MISLPYRTRLELEIHKLAHTATISQYKKQQESIDNIFVTQHITPKPPPLANEIGNMVKQDWH